MTGLTCWMGWIPVAAVIRARVWHLHNFPLPAPTLRAVWTLIHALHTSLTGLWILR